MNKFIHLFFQNLFRWHELEIGSYHLQIKLINWLIKKYYKCDLASQYYNTASI